MECYCTFTVNVLDPDLYLSTRIRRMLNTNSDPDNYRGLSDLVD